MRSWGERCPAAFSVPCGDIHAGCQERGHPATGTRMPQNLSSGYRKDAKNELSSVKYVFFGVFIKFRPFSNLKRKILYTLKTKPLAATIEF